MSVDAARRIEFNSIHSRCSETVPRRHAPDNQGLQGDPLLEHDIESSADQFTIVVKVSTHNKSNPHITLWQPTSARAQIRTTRLDVARVSTKVSRGDSYEEKLHSDFMKSCKEYFPIESTTKD